MSLLALYFLALADGGTPVVKAPPDTGTPVIARAPLSAEDLEVVKNLELLENLDAANDLEMLQELSVER